MNINSIINGISQKSNTGLNPGDYYKDGLLFCGKCHTSKECRIEINDNTLVVGCLCKCELEKRERERAEDIERKKKIKIKQLKCDGIKDEELKKCTFSRATENFNIKKAIKYVESWEKVEKENAGLLFYGDSGCGKTFTAACIVNALIDNGISSAIRSIPKILSADFSQRDEIIKEMSKPRLLVLDDFGAERKSSFSAEIIYTIIDERYKSGKPLILTTNLSLKDIKNPQNMEYNRIYSRVIEMCLPVFFPYIGNREEKASKKMALLRDIFKNEGD